MLGRGTSLSKGYSSFSNCAKSVSLWLNPGYPEGLPFRFPFFSSSFFKFSIRLCIHTDQGKRKLYTNAQIFLSALIRLSLKMPSKEIFISVKILEPFFFVSCLRMVLLITFVTLTCFILFFKRFFKIYLFIYFVCSGSSWRHVGSLVATCELLVAACGI